MTIRFTKSSYTKSRAFDESDHITDIIAMKMEKSEWLNKISDLDSEYMNLQLKISPWLI